MNSFLYARPRALAGLLSPTIAHLSSWIWSEDFMALTSFEDERGQAAKVAVTLFMLKHVALDPRLVEAMQDCLDDGAVAMHYYSTSTPVLPFVLSQDSPELQSIREAFQEALLSRRFQAAVRMKYWNEYCAMYSHRRFAKALDEKFHATLPWPEPRDFTLRPWDAKARQEDCIIRLHAERERMRQHRFARVARIEQMTSRYRSWYDLLDNLVLEVLAPLRQEVVAA